MPYINRADITTKISDQDITACLDDNGDGVADAGLLDIIISTASNAADSYVASIYQTPFDSYLPSKIKDAALIFACEMLYQRRLTPEAKNVFTPQANLWREILKTIGTGQVPLDANVPRKVTPGFAVVTKSVLSIDDRGDWVSMM